MNGLKNWVKRSREQAQRHPERYISSWLHLPRDTERVFMTSRQLEEIKRDCGRYDGTLPTGVYLGKMFLRGECLCWYSISKIDPMNNCDIQSRIIQIVDEGSEAE